MHSVIIDGKEYVLKPEQAKAEPQHPFEVAYAGAGFCIDEFDIDVGFDKRALHFFNAGVEAAQALRDEYIHTGSMTIKEYLNRFADLKYTPEKQ